MTKANDKNACQFCGDESEWIHECNSCGCEVCEDCMCCRESEILDYHLL